MVAGKGPDDLDQTINQSGFPTVEWGTDPHTHTVWTSANQNGGGTFDGFGFCPTSPPKRATSTTTSSSQASLQLQRRCPDRSAI